MESLLTDQEKHALASLQRLGPVAEAREVRPVDLVARDHRAAELLPDLQVAADDFIRLLGFYCTREFRAACVAESAQLELLPADSLRADLTDSRFVFGLTVDGHPGGIAVLDGPLGSAYVSCQFGGAVEPLVGATEHVPTATERRTVSRLVSLMAEAFKRAMGNLAPFTLAVSSEPRVALDDLPVVSLRTSLRVGEVEGRLILALSTAAGAFRRRVPQGAKRASAAKCERLQAALQRAEVEVSSVLGRGETTLRRVTSWRPGDVIVLDTAADGDIELLVGGRAKFRGKPLLTRGSIGLQLSKRITE